MAKVEMTFENWISWKWYRETNSLTNTAIEDKTHKYHKMAACTKMSRKRFGEAPDGHRENR